MKRNENMAKLQAGYLFPEVRAAPAGGAVLAWDLQSWQGGGSRMPAAWATGAATEAASSGEPGATNQEGMLPHSPAARAPPPLPIIRLAPPLVRRRSQRPPSLPTQPCCAPPAAQIARRRRAHQEANPDAQIISLGIGDTTEPIPPAIAKAMRDAAEGLGTLEGYSGCVRT